MSYPINKSNGDLFVTLDDGQLNSDTSVGLVGRNYVGYGEIQNENFLHLLESFASSGPPAKAITGQLWFNTTKKTLNVYDGDAKTWNIVGWSTISQTAPIPAIDGQFWFDSINNQLKVYAGSTWVVVGSESITGFGATKAQSTTLIDAQDNNRPVILLTVNNIVVAIVSADSFKIKPSNPITGFDNIVTGITMSAGFELTGALNGTADYATRLARSVKINGNNFDGSGDITITANTTKSLKVGNYLLGTDFNGSADVTLNVNAAVENTPSTVVARDSVGNFSANEITATLKGQVNAPNGISKFDTIEVKNIIGSSVIQGIAASASKLNPGGTINGVSFTGELGTASGNITVAAAANTLTGTQLATNVVDSSLRTVGILQTLKVGVDGNNVLVGLSGQTPTPTVTAYGNLKIASGGTDESALTFLNKTNSTGATTQSIIPSANTNLGSDASKFNAVYATTFYGVATSASYADLAENDVADGEYVAGLVVQCGGE